MKHLVTAFFSALAFLMGIYGLYKPLGRELIPKIAPFFVGESGIWGTIKNASKQEESEMLISGIATPVRIARDADGIAHIYASNYKDALLGLGYITAKDRLFQIELLSRTVAGELSEWFGSNYAEADKFMLNLGLDKLAWEYHTATINTEEYNLMKTYSAGVNLFINNEARKDRPFVYALLGVPDRFHRPVDGIRVMFFLHYLMNFNVDDLYVQRLVDELGVEAFWNLFDGAFRDITSPDGKMNQRMNTPTLEKRDLLKYKLSFDLITKQLSRFERLTGWQTNSLKSNTSVVQSYDSTHFLNVSLYGPLVKPALFYEVYLHLGQRVIHGFTVPGIPGILFGSNGNVAWSMNPAPLNVVDFTVLDDSVQIAKEVGYQLDVREASNQSLLIRFTKDGSIFSAGNELMELSWRSIFNGNFAVGLNNAVLANDISELNEALAMGPLPVTQIVAADKKSKAYFLSGRIPYRKTYLGIQIHANLPKNNIRLQKSPITWSQASMLTYTNNYPLSEKMQDFPYFSKEGTWRTERYRELIHNLKMPLSNESFTKVNKDYLMYESELRGLFSSIYKGKINSPVNTIGNQLRSWDFLANKDANYPKLFNNFEKVLLNSIFDKLPVPYYPDVQFVLERILNKPNDSLFDNPETPEKETGLSLFSKAFQDAYELSVLESGTTENWTWAVTNRGVVKHISNNNVMNQLNELYVIREGTGSTVLQSYDGTFSYGSILQFSAELSSRYTKTSSLLFPGNSSDRYSQFYENQLPKWTNYELRNSPGAISFDSLKQNGFINFIPAK